MYTQAKECREPLEAEKNKKTTKFLVLCYNGNRKLIQGLRTFFLENSSP